MKKVISNILILALGASVFQLSDNKVKADGWMSYVQDGSLDTWISGVITEDDCVQRGGLGLPSYHADFYKIFIPATGILTLKTDCNKSDDDDYYPRAIDIYNEKTELIDCLANGKYDSAYDIKYDCFPVSAGTYYLEIYGGAKDYQVYFGYEPTVTQTRITSIKTYKKALNVKWDRASGISGYQIQYARNKKMKNPKTITLNNKLKSWTISGLKGKKKYTVRARTFKNINGKTYYSKWTNKVSKKTK